VKRHSSSDRRWLFSAIALVQIFPGKHAQSRVEAVCLDRDNLRKSRRRVC